MIGEVRQWLHAAQRVVALTGAGISTESGIPDFRPAGCLDEESARREAFRPSATTWRTRKCARRRGSRAWTIRPGAPAERRHHALVELEARGKLHALITQNIDELHQQAGNSPDVVIEVHGTVRRVVCMSSACGRRCRRRWSACAPASRPALPPTAAAS